MKAARSPLFEAGWKRRRALRLSNPPDLLHGVDADVAIGAQSVDCHRLDGHGSHGTFPWVVRMGVERGDRGSFVARLGAAVPMTRMHRELDREGAVKFGRPPSVARYSNSSSCGMRPASQ